MIVEPNDTNWWLRGMGYIEAGFAEAFGEDVADILMAWIFILQAVAVLLLFIWIVILSEGWALWSIPALLTLLVYKAYKLGKKKQEEELS